MPSFVVYSAADFGLSDTFANWLASPDSTVSASMTVDLLEMTDDDSRFEDEGAGSDQLLVADLYIDGVLVGSIGDVVINLGQSTITNATTGEIGLYSVVQVNGVAVGYSSTIVLNPGDDITTNAWAGTAQDIAYDDLVPSCFCRGTKILTRQGDVVIEQLKTGDQIWTRDSGFKKILWIGVQICNGQGALAPVLIKSGALGNACDLTVSPMHRMLIGGWQAEIIFGQAEFLVPARDLVNGRDIVQTPRAGVQYFHLMFDDHQIINSAGCLSESFHPHRADLDGFGAAARAELFEVFPDLAKTETAPAQTAWPDIRPTLNPAESMLLQSL